MANHEEIKAFLEGLDPSNDELFTSTGSVKMDVIKAQFGDDVVRDEVNAAWPDFNRNALVKQASDDAPVADQGKTDVQRINDELADLEKQHHELTKSLKAKQQEAIQAIEQEQAVGQIHQAEQVRLLAQESRRIEQEGFKEDLKKLMDKIG